MIAQKLKQARQNKGFSQDEVANKLKITRQSISKWENGHVCPDVINLKLLCTLYEISVDDILLDDFTFENSNKQTKSHDKTSKDEYSKKLENLFLVTISIVSCLIPFLGVAVSLVILIHLMKSPKECTLSTKIIITICFILSCINIFIILNDVFFHFGKATIY